MSAPQGNVLPSGTVELEFKGIRLHGWATDLSDDIQWRIAVHEFDQVNGAQTENMGRGPWQMRVTLLFVGADAFLDAQSFIQGLEINPSGLLVHPIYGRRQATCSGTQGATLTAAEANAYRLPVTFTENSLNASVIGDGSQGVAAQSQAVQVQATALTTLAAVVPAAAAAVGALTASATALASAAVASAAASSVDPSVVAGVAGLPTTTATAIAALQSSSVPEAADAAMAAEVLLSMATTCVRTLLAQSSASALWVTPSDMTLIQVAEQLYGGDAFSYVGQIVTNNPQVLGLTLIPAGTALYLAPSTV
jgi:prophage DNA circulation protein